MSPKNSARSGKKPNDVHSGGRRVRPPSEEDRRMAELYAGGMSGEKIAGQFGCSPKKVYRALRKLGVIMRPGAAVRKTPEKKHRRIVQLYESGLSCRDIAKQFGYSAEGIRAILQKHDVEMRPAHAHGRFSEADCRKMAKLYKQGHSRTKIAARFDCDPATLNRVLRLQGVEIRPEPPRHVTTRKERERIVRLHHQGVSRSEIAAKIGCVQQTVSEILRKHGIRMRVHGSCVYSDEDQQRIAGLYQAGISMERIAADFDCKRSTVESVLRKRGVKIRPPGSQGLFTMKLRARILTLYKAGFSGTEIAAKFDCDLKMVASVVERATGKSRKASNRL